MSQVRDWADAEKDRLPDSSRTKWLHQHLPRSSGKGAPPKSTEEPPDDGEEWQQVPARHGGNPPRASWAGEVHQGTGGAKGLGKGKRKGKGKGKGAREGHRPDAGWGSQRRTHQPDEEEHRHSERIVRLSVGSGHTAPSDNAGQGWDWVPGQPVTHGSYFPCAPCLQTPTLREGHGQYNRCHAVLCAQCRCPSPQCQSQAQGGAKRAHEAQRTGYIPPSARGRRGTPPHRDDTGGEGRPVDQGEGEPEYQRGPPIHRRRH